MCPGFASYSVFLRILLLPWPVAYRGVQWRRFRPCFLPQNCFFSAAVTHVLSRERVALELQL